MKSSASRIVVGLVVPAATVLSAVASGAGSVPSPDAIAASAPPAAGVALLPAALRRAEPGDLPDPTTAVPGPTSTPTRPAPAHTPGVPDCARTNGDAGGFRFSLDGGASLAPNAHRLADLAYTWALDVDPRDPDVVFELHQGRLFRSTDAGCSFVALAGLPQDEWDALVRAPSDPELVVLTTIFHPRLAYTVDSGNRWSVEELPDDVVALSIDPAARWRWTFVGRQPSIYSRDAPNEPWTRRPIPMDEGQSVIAAASVPSRPSRWLVATSTRGLLRSEDGGDTWSPSSDGLFGPIAGSGEETRSVVVSFVAVAPSNPDIVYATANQVGRGGSLRGLWRSTDGGASWSLCVKNGDVVGPATARLNAGTRVFVSPEDPDRTYFAFGMAYNTYGTDLYRSRDGLSSFQASHFDGFYKVYAMAFSPADPSVVFVGASSDIPSD